MKIIETITGATEKTITLTGNMQGVTISTEDTFANVDNVIVTALLKREGREPIVLIQPQVIAGVMAMNKVLGRQNVTVLASQNLHLLFANGNLELNDQFKIELSLSGLTDSISYDVYDIVADSKATTLLTYVADNVAADKFSKEVVGMKNVIAIAIGKDVVSAEFTSTAGYSKKKTAFELSVDDAAGRYFGSETATGAGNVDDYYVQETVNQRSLILNTAGSVSVPYIMLVPKDYTA